MADRPDSDVVEYSSPKPGSRMATWVKIVIIAGICSAIALSVGAVVLLMKARVRIATAKLMSTVAQISNLKVALETFESDNGRYPTQAEGLKAMVHAPPGLPDWHRLLDDVPKDAWGNDFRYLLPGKKHLAGYDLTSAGPDGKFGTPDDIER